MKTIAVVTILEMDGILDSCAVCTYLAWPTGFRPPTLYYRVGGPISTIIYNFIDKLF